VKLVARNTHSISLTDGGRLYQQRCRRIIEELSEAEGGRAEQGSRVYGVSVESLW